MSEFKNAFAKLRNENEQIRDSFLYWFVDIAQGLDFGNFVLQEIDAFEELHGEIWRYFETDIIDRIIDINRAFAKSLAKNARAEFSDTYRLPEKYIDLYKRQTQATLDYALKKFDIALDKMDSIRKPESILETDWKASMPEVERKKMKERMKDKIRFKAGKFYAPIFKGLFNEFEKVILNLSAKITNDMQNLIKVKD